MKPTRTEMEIKLIAQDAAALRGLRGALGAICHQVRYCGRETIVDTYLDTRDWRLYQAGFACRVRQTARRAILTLKALRRPRNMVSLREEFEEALPLPLPRRINHLPGKRVCRKVVPIVGEEPLRPLFRVRNRRATYAVKCPPHLTAHVSADDFTILSGRKSRRLAEIEVESAGGSLAELRRLARRLAARMNLKSAGRTKFAEGLRLGGHIPKGRPR